MPAVLLYSLVLPFFACDMTADCYVYDGINKQLLFDVEYAYTEFFRSLSGGAKDGGGS